VSTIGVKINIKGCTQPYGLIACHSLLEYASADGHPVVTTFV